MAEYEDIIKFSVDEDVSDDKLNRKVKEEVTRQLGHGKRNTGNTHLLRKWISGRHQFSTKEIQEAFPLMKPSSIRSFLTREDYVKNIEHGEWVNISARQKPTKPPGGTTPGGAYTNQDAQAPLSDEDRDQILKEMYKNNKGSGYTRLAKQPIFDPSNLRTGALADKTVDEYTLDRLVHSRAIHQTPANPEFHVEGQGAPIDLVNNFQLNKERNKIRGKRLGFSFRLNRQNLTNLLKFGTKGGQIATNPYGVLGNILGNLARMGPLGYAVAGVAAGLISGNVTAKVFIQKMGLKGYPLNRDFFRIVDDHNYGLWSVEEEKRRLLGYDSYIVTQTDRYTPQDGGTTYNSLENRDAVILSKIGLAEKAVGIDYQGWK